MNYIFSFSFSYRSPANGEIHYAQEEIIDGSFSSYVEGYKSLNERADEEVLRMEYKEWEILEVVKTCKRKD